MLKFVCVIVGLLVVLCAPVFVAPAHAGEPRVLVDVGFDKPGWQEIIKRNWGADASVDGGALKLGARTSYTTELFPYKSGEEIDVSVRLKCRGVEASKSAWNVGRVVITCFNGDKQGMCHFDCAMVKGDTDWQIAKLARSFTDAIKYYRIELNNEGKSGTVWFDGFSVRVSDANAAVKPFDAERATVTIDVAKPGPTINYRVWAGVDVSYASFLLRDDVREAVALVANAGIELIRVHEISNGLDIYPRDDESGRPVYDWTKFDSVFDVLVKTNAMIPIVTLESTPPALDKPGTRTVGWRNSMAPKDPVKWGAYVEAIMEHSIERYGKSTVGNWLWEVWNEPDPHSHYYTDSVDGFAALAEQSYLAADRVEKRHGINIRMGLTSGGTPVMNEAILNRLKDIGRLDLIDDYSLHFYCGAGTPVRSLAEQIPLMRDLKKRYPGIKDYQIGCTEWNGNSMGGEFADTPWNATLAVKAVRIMLDAGLDYAAFFNLYDHPALPGPQPVFEGSLGMFTKNCVPKPVFNAFVFLNQLKGGNRLRLDSTNDPVDGLAVKTADGSIMMVLANYDEDTSRQPYETSVTIEVKGLDGRYVCSRAWIADSDHGNSHKLWQELGKPSKDDKQARDKMVEASKYGVMRPPTLSHVKGAQTLQVTLPSPGILFLELKPEVGIK